ncbi:hypothetical protein QBC47DRAFT_291602 [Echria macrotheca]|uniref:Uncharacterized protein n=1 Tax=Echria macrotheca TaxID=438768 RepID=A0AAJ0BKG4_9PEZI|nr:hypothetical protein QBC47DRAFT_291602 [Echria macrotheca]
MGHTSKFTFPIPGRRSKPAPAPSPPMTTPRTKAQKILGTGEINTEASTLSPDAKWGWETRSNSGISISVSETTASHSDMADAGLGTVHEAEVLGSGRKGRWDDESEIIPRVFQGPSHGHDTITDASSLRRRQSSSTITSYYDKAKLPLSISQQTSNSAMAKGLPTKVQALLDIEGNHVEHKEKSKKKKPAMLDLSALLPKPKSSSRFLKPDSGKGHLLGPDLFTKSPSIMSLSPDATPPPILQRAERGLRKKLTKESLREAGTTEARHRPTKSTVDLLNLYDHYEQRSFADVFEQEVGATPEPSQHVPSYPTPPTSSAGNAYLSPQQSKPMRIAIPTKQSALLAQELALASGASPSSLVSPPGDSASISSRHTRTSKASKRTDRSLTDFDLQQNSVLSLSSDSESEAYEPSSKSSLAPPALSDGQASPTSPRSAVSQRSAATVPQEANRGKPKRASFATQSQFLPIPEGSATANPPRVTTRTSSLSLQSVPRKQTSRLSIGTTSTSRTAGTVIPGRPESASPTAGTRNGPSHQATQSTTSLSRFDDFPSPPTTRAPRQSATRQSVEEPTPPLSPTSVDFYLQSQRGSRMAFEIDNRSTHSGKSLGSMRGPKRSDSISSQTDSSSGRFMAVTRQEEMLLAALRMKRARMREDIIAEFEEHMGREEEEDLQRQITNESSGVSRQSSMSTVRTVEAGSVGALTARPHHPQIRVSADADKRMDAGIETAEPSPDLDGFLGFEDIIYHMPQRSGSKASSKASGDSASGGSSRSRKTSLSAVAARTKSRSKENLFRRESDQASLRSGSRRGSDKDLPGSILEDPREAEEEADIPRPDSPISPDDFPTPMSMTRKKQVRLSAVGNYRPNIEAGWWDDSG